MTNGNLQRLLLTIILSLAPCVQNCLAETLEIPAVFSDGTVLQRGEPVPVWGWAGSGATVAVEFNGQKKSTVVGADGTWQVKLDPMKARNTGQKMVVVCGDDSKTINNVVVGEVWFCSGQSNMTVTLGFLSQFPVTEKRYQPVVEFIDMEIETAHDPLLRHTKIVVTQ